MLFRFPTIPLQELYSQNIRPWHHLYSPSPLPFPNLLSSSGCVDFDLFAFRFWSQLCHDGRAPGLLEEGEKLSVDWQLEVMWVWLSGMGEVLGTDGYWLAANVGVAIRQLGGLQGECWVLVGVVIG